MSVLLQTFGLRLNYFKSNKSLSVEYIHTYNIPSTINDAVTMEWGARPLPFIARATYALQSTSYHVHWRFKCKVYIPLGLFLVLRWQLSPTQVKCTCNANDSTYIPLGFSIKLRIIRGSVLGICKCF